MSQHEPTSHRHQQLPRQDLDEQVEVELAEQQVLLQEGKQRQLQHVEHRVLAEPSSELQPPL